MEDTKTCLEKQPLSQEMLAGVLTTICQPVSYIFLTIRS